MAEYVPNRLPYENNKRLTVVNFFGGPGTGKSVCAAELFAKMKKHDYKVELVHEVAKDFVWEQWSHIFGEQDYIFAHQHRLIRRLVAHDIDYAIVDSSILLSLFYMPDDFPKSFRVFVKDVFDTYENINIYLRRSPKIAYQQTGRNESPQQAREKDDAIFTYFTENKIPFWDIMAGDAAPSTVFQIIEQRDHWKDRK